MPLMGDGDRKLKCFWMYQSLSSKKNQLYIINHISSSGERYGIEITVLDGSYVPTVRVF
jgi:hypothetical protein